MSWVLTKCLVHNSFRNDCVNEWWIRHNADPKNGSSNLCPNMFRFTCIMWVLRPIMEICMVFWITYVKIKFFLLGVECATKAEIDQHLNLGMQMLTRGQYSDALSHFHAAVGKKYLHYNYISCRLIKYIYDYVCIVICNKYKGQMYYWSGFLEIVIKSFP